MIDDEPTPPPHRLPPRRPRSNTPWAMLVGVALLVILALVMAFLVIGGNGDETDASPTPTTSVVASTSASASAAQNTSPTESASASAAPSGTPVSLTLDTIVAAAVSDLSVRSNPTTGSTRLGSLASGMLGFVADGPTDADGYRWYLLAALGLPPSTGCEGEETTNPFSCPTWLGWVASGDPSGVPWLMPHEAECPSSPLQVEDLVIGRTDLQRLACFASNPFTFRAWWPTAPTDGPPGDCPSRNEPSGWLLCQRTNAHHVVVDTEQDHEGLGVDVMIDPASGVTMPARGTWVELRVHLDDPAGHACGDAALAHGGTDPAASYVLFCRGRMVAESAVAVDGP